MESKLQKALNSLRQWEDVLACPICAQPLHTEQNRVCCARGHTWDVNRKGFVNLLSRPHVTYYDRQLFEARGRLFEAGAYEPVLRALEGCLKPGMRVMDAGCGEGFYLDALSRKMPLQGVGIDISRDAIAQAACHETPQLWLVGDVTRLPFKDHSFDVILDILTPASYQSFWRVLKPEGLLLKVYPDTQYLKELREALGLPCYQAGEVEDHTRRNARLVERQVILKTLELTPQMYRDFVFMTPLTQRLTLEEKEAVARKPVRQMTLHLTLDVLRPKE